MGNLCYVNICNDLGPSNSSHLENGRSMDSLATPFCANFLFPTPKIIHAIQNNLYLFGGIQFVGIYWFILLHLSCQHEHLCRS
jgi:hypothetical protein